jgi:hypothetical protein
MLGEHGLRVLRKIFGLKREDTTQDTGKHCLIKELHDYCSAINIIRAIKSRKMRCRGGAEVHTGIWCGNLKKEIMWKSYA